MHLAFARYSPLDSQFVAKPLQRLRRSGWCHRLPKGSDRFERSKSFETISNDFELTRVGFDLVISVKTTRDKVTVKDYFQTPILAMMGLQTVVDPPAAG